MALRTAFTELLGLRHPIALAPMGGSAGGALAAAVSNAGGLGLLGGGNGNRNWLARELPAVNSGTRGPWGVGFQSWAVDAAAALALGAAGALVGTRLLATAEALEDAAAKKAIVDGSGEDTERSSVLDIARGSRWPREYTGRTLAHPFLDEWRDREDELAASAAARSDYQRGVDSGELPPQPVWASQAIDLITDLPPAAEVVASLAAQAEEALARVLGR
jgi:NAD(P)H-dependent flavin oxidoreductase YrpB (nitropropane dioxygenase family)